jgi:hypothetical protein
MGRKLVQPENCVWEVVWRDGWEKSEEIALLVNGYFFHDVSDIRKIEDIVRVLKANRGLKMPYHSAFILTQYTVTDPNVIIEKTGDEYYPLAAYYVAWGDNMYSLLD